MADQKLTQLDAITSLSETDIVYLVSDPSGTPISKKMTVANLRIALNQMPSNDYIYFGSPTSDGTWRIGLNSGSLSFERRESSSWVQKGAVDAS